MINTILKFSIIILFLASCKKDAQEPIPEYNSCKIAEERKQDDKLITTIKYNSDNKPVKITSYELDTIYGTTIITYNGDSIIFHYSDPYFGTVITKAKIVNERIEKEASIHYSYDDNLLGIDTITFEYDADGYLIKKIHTEYHIIPITTSSNINTFEYTISNGNVISRTQTSSNTGTTSLVYFEYYSDQENKLGTSADGLSPYGLDLYGKLNKNLLKRGYTPGDPSLAHIDYEYRPDGYISKKIYIASDGITVSRVFKYIYFCE